MACSPIPHGETLEANPVKIRDKVRNLLQVPIIQHLMQQEKISEVSTLERNNKAAIVCRWYHGQTRKSLRNVLKKMLKLIRLSVQLV